MAVLFLVRSSIRETMLDKTIKQPISRIIEALGWERTDVDPERTNPSQ